MRKDTQTKNKRGRSYPLQLNEQLQNANHEVMNQEESHLATRISQGRNIQKAFISIDTSSPLSTNL
jgi:membrane peptidoglycan carboxypeptidase